MIDSQYFHNKEGFGYMLKKLPRGNYQVQIKKYSSGFDVYDFTARIYAPKSVKMVDVEQQDIKKAKKKQDAKMKSAGISRTITESSASHESGEAKKHFTKAGD